jgi:hypothetical protein
VSVVCDFESQVYEPSALDRPDDYLLAGQLRPGWLQWAQAQGDEVLVWSDRLSPRPGGVELMVDWLRERIVASGVRVTLDVSFPRERPAP